MEIREKRTQTAAGRHAEEGKKGEERQKSDFHCEPDDPGAGRANSFRGNDNSEHALKTQGETFWRKNSG